MRAMRRQWWPGLLLVSACAFDGAEASPQVDAELAALVTETRAAVDKIDRALEGPALASNELGEGVRAIEDVTRAFARLETDERSNHRQRLRSVVYQARAWDDAYWAIVGDARAHLDLDPAQRVLLATVLREKAFPAQVAAESSYERALRHVCRAAPSTEPALLASSEPLLLEILDGIERHGGRVLSPARACD